MNGTTTLLVHLPPKRKAKIVEIHGGFHLQRKLCSMGLRRGQIVEVISRQPMFGPLTIKSGNCSMTIGRGMAQKITVELP